MLVLIIKCPGYLILTLKIEFTGKFSNFNLELKVSTNFESHVLFMFESAVVDM